MTQPVQFSDFIEKKAVRAIIQTTKQTLVGYLHITPKLRLIDVLNRDHDEFMAVTDLILVDSKKQIKFLILQRDEIVWIAPLENEESISDYLPGL